jgi:hypothetical protein
MTVSTAIAVTRALEVDLMAAVHAACGQVRTAASIQRITFASRSPITRNFVLRHTV